MGLADPRVSEMQQLEYTVKGFRKLSGGKARPRLPITPVILEKLRKYWASSSILERHDTTMLWAASCMCFFGFLRTGEVVVPSDTGNDWSSALPSGSNLELHGQQGVSPGAILRVQRPSPINQGSPGKRVRQAMQVSGIDDKLYSGHSFRIGAATTAASCGLQDSLIKTLGRWESAAYTIYIRTPRTELCGVAAKLVAAARQC
eukprot:Em0003g805a